MASTARDRHGDKTIADWRALPDDHRFELIDGELVEKAMPTFDHGRSQGMTITTISGAFDRRIGGPHGPGGWWIASEVDILLDGRIFRPDILGWRRDRVPTPPRERPVEVRPDWICEIVSESNRATDTITKVRRYHRGGVLHYWLLDQTDRSLTVYRHTIDGYLVALRAEASEPIRAEQSRSTPSRSWLAPCSVMKTRRNGWSYLARRQRSEGHRQASDRAAVVARVTEQS